jgi:tetratricopeptide (TPR) repeat protein
MLRQLSEKLRLLLVKSAPREPLPEQSRAPKPDSSWLERGLALQRAGRSEEALASFNRAVEAKHDDVEALVGQAETHIELGHSEDAADCFELAIAFAPDHLPALLGLGRLYREAGDREVALRLLERAAQAAPRSAEPHFELGRTHRRHGNPRAALTSYERALELEPNHVGACVNAGLIHLAQLGDAGSAQRFFERAVKLQPDSVAAQANLGLALQEQGQFAATLAHYDRLIAAHPEVIEYRWNRAIAYLHLGDFERGWQGYELRHTRGGQDVRRHFPLPEWNGGDLSGHHILVYGEQGLGDEIMFASCVPDLLRLAAGVVIECDERLAPLFQRSFPAAVVHGAPRDGKRDWLQAFPELGVQVAAGSLPHFFRRDWSDFPRHDGYLAADATRRAQWQTRLAALGGGFKVGFCWRGGTLKTRRELRSLALTDCLPLLQRKDCEFICLQSGDCSEEIAAAREHGGRLHWWPEATRDVDELAALIGALDAVVAVPSTIVHLSGALGRTVWVMLSASPEWRYLWRGERMPWYPSVRLFRQSQGAGWEPVIASVYDELTAWLNAKSAV